MGYIGAKNLKEISKGKICKNYKGRFYESMVHSVEMTQKKSNYKLWQNFLKALVIMCMLTSHLFASQNIFRGY